MVEARLQLEMRAKEIALDRILLDGDCVFGFSSDTAEEAAAWDVPVQPTA